MEMKPLSEIDKDAEPVQVPLFLESIPEKAEFLSPKNIEDIDIFLSQKLFYMVRDGKISGADYFRLFRFASENGISDEVLKKYLSEKDISINSNLPPEPKTNFSLH
ncbi:MAG: hypothetical protein WCT07_02230 [Candidatus Paceibacterota bacterium]|jgi:hypothetical protein